MARYSKDKEINKILQQLVDQGWKVELRNGHWQCKSPCGRYIVTNGSTPSEYRGVKNFKSQLRRAGAKIA